MTIHLGPPATQAGDVITAESTAGLDEPVKGPDEPAREAHRRRPGRRAPGPAPRAARSWRPGRRALPAAAVVLLVAAALAWVGVHRAGADPGVRTVVVTMHHSRFQAAAITVAPGSTVRFVLRNTDPIDHEFILGGKAVHELHERGTQRSHNAPGEISVPAGQERSTTVSFNLAAPGALEYACHLPGHYAYGMRGLVRVAR
jgi:uncharacterized cupredoxin-like copper-binding protein